MDSPQSCQVCSAESPDSHLCENCNKVTYCTIDHQKADWQRHKEDCYPAKIERDEVIGRFMVATRDIKQGEIIFHEKPLMTGPGANFPSTLMPLCLSCYKQVTSSYVCTLCKWPMCGHQCEQLSQHRDFECRILAKNNIRPVKQPVEYICINVLRCLLLRKAEPGSWEKILGMEAHSKASLRSANSISVFGLVWQFIETRCNLTEFDGAVIRQVLGAIEVNIHHFTDAEEDTGIARQAEGQFLFSKLSILSHNCSPNTIWKRNNEKNPPSTFSVSLYASVPIKKGEQIFNRYTNIIKDTVSRKKYLREGYYFDCKCNRCRSPTELGTFYSAIKCPAKTCSSYLLHAGYYISPIDTDCNSGEPIWKCQECSVIKDYTFIRNIEKRLAANYNSIQPDEILEKFEMLEEFVHHHEKYSVHPNYYFLVQVKHTMLKILNELTSKYAQSTLLTLEQKILCKKQIEVAQNLLLIMNVLCPGYSLERGRLLYYIHNAKFTLYLHEYRLKEQPEEISSSLGKLSFLDSTLKDLCSQIVSSGNEAIIISQFGPDGSEAQKMGNIAKQNLKCLFELLNSKNDNREENLQSKMFELKFM